MHACRYMYVYIKRWMPRRKMHSTFASSPVRFAFRRHHSLINYSIVYSTRKNVHCNATIEQLQSSPGSRSTSQSTSSSFQNSIQCHRTIDGDGTLSVSRQLYLRPWHQPSGEIRDPLCPERGHTWRRGLPVLFARCTNIDHWFAWRWSREHLAYIRSSLCLHRWSSTSEISGASAL